MKCIVKRPTFIRGQLVEPGKNGAPIDLPESTAKALIACGAGFEAPRAEKAAKPEKAEKAPKAEKKSQAEEGDGK